jgi:hypothetical protein
MKTNHFLVTLALSATILTQSAFAGVAYTAGTLPKGMVVPNNVGFVIPAINDPSANPKAAPQTLETEVFLVPTQTATFKLDLETEDTRGGLADLETRCFTHELDSDDYKTTSKEAQAIKKKIRSYQDKIDDLSDELIEAETQADKDSVNAKIQEIDKLIAKQQQRLADTQAVIEKYKLSLGELASTPSFNLAGKWNNNFAAEKDILDQANKGKGIKVLPLSTKLKSVVTTGIGTDLDKPFRYLMLNGHDFVNKGNPYQIRNQVPEKILENGEKDGDKVKVKIADALNYRDSEPVHALEQNGSVDIGLYLAQGCAMMKGGSSKVGNHITMIKAYPTAVFFRGIAKYNLSSLYKYFEKNSKGPAGGWNPTRQELAKKVRSELTKENGFEFIYRCSKTDVCPPEEKVREEMKTRLLDIGMKLFTESVLDTSKESLPLPANEMGTAIAEGVDYFYPGTKAFVKPLADSFMSSQSTVDIENKINVTVTEDWDQIYFSEEYVSQTISMQK